MGHNRLGRLPRTRRWREVVALLDQPTASAESIAAAVANAAENRFRQLAHEDALPIAFWTIARVTAAARGETFLQDLDWLGFGYEPDVSGLGLISGTASYVRDEFARLPDQSDFNEIAVLAVGSALTETVGREGPGLFSSTAEDAQRSFRTYSTAARFGELARIFFADFMARSLRSFVDRELSNHIGDENAVRTTGESSDFLAALDLHTHQAARVVEGFAGSWYSLHNWETKVDISLDETRRFVAQALRKLRAELKRGAED